jgi:hypothetical protein
VSDRDWRRLQELAASSPQPAGFTLRCLEYFYARKWKLLDADDNSSPAKRKIRKIVLRAWDICHDFICLHVYFRYLVS